MNFAMLQVPCAHSQSQRTCPDPVRGREEYFPASQRHQAKRNVPATVAHESQIASLRVGDISLDHSEFNGHCRNCRFHRSDASRSHESACLRARRVSSPELGRGVHPGHDFHSPAHEQAAVPAAILEGFEPMREQELVKERLPVSFFRHKLFVLEGVRPQ